MGKSSTDTIILIFGANGMIGHTLYSELSENNEFRVYGTIRNIEYKEFFPDKYQKNLITDIDVTSADSVQKIISDIKPNIIINAVGIVKQLSESNDISKSFVINSLWPHQLVGYAKLVGAYVIQLSSDCVFSGKQGMYQESDPPDPIDIYGQTKWLGELHENKTITIRTSTIGTELSTHHGLLEWFLSQTGEIDGYGGAIYSGIPTVELAKVIAQYIIPQINLFSGVFHISSKPITKYHLLELIATKYNKRVTINKVAEPIIDRSLDCEKFNTLTNYQPRDWNELVKEMYEKDT